MHLKKLAFSPPAFYYIGKRQPSNHGNNLTMSYLFTSEAVSAGHPDKICDQISDTLLDLFLAADPTAHTAIEAMATTGRIVIAGETLGNNRPQAEEIENAVRTLIKRSV